MGKFFITGHIFPSNSGKSYRVYMICQEKTRIFVGLISRKEISTLLRGDIEKANISKYTDNPNGIKAVQEKIDFCSSFTQRG